MDVAATLHSPAYADLIPGDDPKYKMYHSDKYDGRFGTRHISPPTREEHGRREYFGAPYRFANDSGNSFESGRPTDHSPSPELEDVPRVFVHRPLSRVLEYRDSESDFSNPFGQWYWRQQEEEERQDALLRRQQRAELLAVRKDRGYNPIALPPPPRLPQRPNDQIHSPNMVSFAPSIHDNPSIDREAQGFLWHGIWHPPPFPSALPTPDESDIEHPRPEKRKRGRPRKEQKAAVVLNIPKGGVLPSKRKLGKRRADQVEALVFGDAEGEMDTTQPVKRKRGRPRKSDGTGLNMMTTQSSTKVQKDGRTAAERTILETSALPQEPDTREFEGRLGAGGKYKAGEAPGDKTSLPLPMEKENAENGLVIASSSTEKESKVNKSAIPSSFREKEKEVNTSAVVLSPMEGSIYEPDANSDADVGPPGDGEREERSRSPEEDDDDDDVAVISYNFLIPVVLQNRATRSGREFA